MLRSADALCDSLSHIWEDFSWSYSEAAEDMLGCRLALRFWLGIMVWWNYAQRWRGSESYVGELDGLIAADPNV